MTINEIIQIGDEGVNKLSEEQLKKTLVDASRYARDRRKRALRAVEERNLPTPVAYKEWGDKPLGRKWSSGLAQYKSWKEIPFEKYDSMREVNGLDKQELQDQLRLTIRFLNTKTSTKEEWERYLSNFKKTVGLSKYSRNVTKEEFYTFWDTINRLSRDVVEGTDYKYEEHREGGTYNTLYGEVIKEIRRLQNERKQGARVRDRSDMVDIIYERIQERLEKDYIRRQEEENKSIRRSEYDFSDNLGRKGL